MNTQTMKKFEERLSPLRERLDHLERLTEVKGVDAVARYSAEEDELLRQIHALATLALQAGEAFSRTFRKRLKSLVGRLLSLPSVPRIESIKLAQAILALHPLILVTDEITDEEQQQPTLTRIFLMEPTKVPCLDYQFPALLYDNAELSMDEVRVLEATKPVPESLGEAWTKLQKVLHGRYVISFDVRLVQLQLAVTAQRNGLPVPMLVGHSLLDLLLKYARVKEAVEEEESDEDVPLPPDSQLYDVLAQEDIEPFVDDSIPAEQRAYHLLQALEAMADGTLSLQEPLPVSSLLSPAVSM
jgi:hypothetical protein